MREEAAHGEAMVVRQPRALDAIAEKLAPGVPPGGRHVREQDAVAGIAPRERVDEGRGGARLGDGNRVDPDARRALHGRVPSEALA